MSLLDINENVEQQDIRTAFIKRIENIIIDEFYRMSWNLGSDELPNIHVSIPKEMPQYFTIGARVKDSGDETCRYYKIFDAEKMTCTPNGIIQLDDDEQLELNYNSTYETVAIGRYIIKTNYPPKADTIRLRVWKSDDVFSKTADFGYIDLNRHALQYALDRYRGLKFINILKGYSLTEHERLRYGF